VCACATNCASQNELAGSAKRRCEGRDKENMCATVGSAPYLGEQGSNAPGAGMAELLGGHLACPICVSVPAG